jgi:hypothetical protein
MAAVDLSSSAGAAAAPLRVAQAPAKSADDSAAALLREVLARPTLADGSHMYVDASFPVGADVLRDLQWRRPADALGLVTTTPRPRLFSSGGPSSGDVVQVSCF